MDKIVLRQCYFCKDWFPVDQVTELLIDRNPSGPYEDVFSCLGCLKTSRIERLMASATRALGWGVFNEVEVTEGEVKVHLVRFTPVPYQSPPAPVMGQKL